MTLKKRIARCFKTPRACALTCYAIAVIAVLAYSVLCAGWDAINFATGRFTTQTLTLADTSAYTLDGFAYDGAHTLTAQVGDPHLTLMPGQQVRRITVIVEDVPAYAERDLYYHLPGLGYTPLLRVWPTLRADGMAYEYELPLITGRNIRLDLCDNTGASIAIRAFFINEPRALWCYFVPNAWALFWLCFAPGLVALSIGFARDAVAYVMAKPVQE